MEKLLSLILSIFTDANSLQALLGKLLEALLGNVDDPEGCKERLLAWIKAGTLDDRFKADPLGTLICVATVMLELAKDWHEPDPDAPVDPENPLIFADPYTQQLADALEVPIPAGGPIADKLIEMILERLLQMLKDWLSE